jgi:hypothetical protein
VSIHKAAPIETHDGLVCATCKLEVKKVPGGSGPTWVHTATGAVAGPDVPPTEFAPPTNRLPVVGDVLKIQRPPYEGTATVVRVTDIGVAILHNDDMRLVGYPAGHRQWSPGDRSATPPVERVMLTEDDQEAFIGMAHWPSLEYVNLDEVPPTRDPRDGYATDRIPGGWGGKDD